jgi:hypothetical protein
VWLELARALQDGDAVEGVLPQLEAVLRFARDVQRRVGEVGVDGISGVLGIHRRLAAVLDGVSVAQLEGLRADVRALEHAFQALAHALVDLKRLQDEVTRQVRR